MIAVLRHPTYAKLFSAQVLALLGTGLLTVALGLLAFDIAGGDAGIVMGIAMTIKMVAYVTVSPLATALLARLPRKPVLISADLVRAAVAIALPFVDQPWQIYVLIFILQSASATFTPTFQAVIPSVLPREGDYTKALSLSRLAYDLESLLSPMLAAVLLTVISFHNLFMGTVVGFLVSAVLVTATTFPHMDAPPVTRFVERLTLGIKVFGRSSELRALMGLNLVVATTTAMVIVNTVVLVQGGLARSPRDVALILALYGAGSMLVALVLPSVLERMPDRPVMLNAAASLPLLLCVSAVVIWAGEDAMQWPALLVLWFLTGAATSAILTPSARLLRRGSTEKNRSAVFAAQFSISHACFLITYPLAGVLGAAIGLAPVALVLAAIAILGYSLAARAWRDQASNVPQRPHSPVQ